MNPKIVYFDLAEWQRPYVTGELHRFPGEYVVESIQDTDIKKYKDTEIISIFIDSRVEGKILGELPYLKFIATRSTGYDHIDLEACAKQKILVANVPFYGENTVAEHAFALLLAISRRFRESQDRIIRDDFDYTNLVGFDLKGKTLGIVGGGHIGLHVARIANGFEMKVLVFDVKKENNLAKKYHFTYAKDLDELLEQSDIVTLHVPLMPATKHLINEKNISKFKRGAILINTARGGLVETKALIKALDEGQLAWAGLDVLEGEEDLKDEIELLLRPAKKTSMRTVIADHVLMNHPKVVVTPHNAFNSAEALVRIYQTNADNIEAFLKGEPINLVKS